MKRMISLLLCLAMMLALCACGSKTEPETTTPPETTAATEAAAPETTEAAQETVPAETEPDNSFDTSWASNEFEELIPQPPFSDLTGEQSAETRYQLMSEPGALDYSAESADRAALDAYVASLEGYGFTVIPEGYSHPDFIGAELPDSWMILDNLGSKISISLTCDDHTALTGSLFITIKKANGPVVDTEALGGVYTTLPDAVWTSKEEVTDTFGFLFTQYVTHEAMAAYCDYLLAEGFTITEEGEPYRSNISKTFVNANGDEIYVKYEGEEDYGTGNLKITLVG